MPWIRKLAAVLFVSLLAAGPASAQDEGADFQLKRLGTISGRIVTEASGEPLSAVKVSVYNLAGNLLQLVETDAQGGFHFEGLLAGTYFLKANPDGGYLDEIYDDIPCFSPLLVPAVTPAGKVADVPPLPLCNPIAGTPLAITGDTETIVEMALLRGGTVSGRVTDELTGEPVPDVLVVAEPTAVPLPFVAISDSDGRYEIRGLPSGPYLFGTYQTDEYLGQITETSFLAETDVTFDFALTPGGRISGTVVGASTGEPVAVATAHFWDADGLLASAETDDSGRYSYGPLAAGTYEVRVTSPFFLPATREDVLVVVGEETAGVDFALLDDGVARGALSGRVVAEESGLPIRGAYVSVFPQLPENSLVAQATDYDGRYRFESLAAGTYRVRVYAFSLYEDEVYDDVLCGSCDPTLGTAVEVKAGRVTSGIDFALARDGKLEGQVFDEATGEVVREGDVVVFDPTGLFLAEVDLTDGSFSFDSLDSGRYYVATRTLDYVDEAYPGLLCLPATCDFAGADLVEVETGVATEIAFSLSRGSRLTGKVRAAETGDRLPGVPVTVHDRTGTALLTAWTNERGVYDLKGLPGGRYYISTPGAHGYLGELFGGLPCPFAQCDVTAGQPVGVRLGTTRHRVDLELDFGAGSLSGTVREESTAQRVGDLLIRVYDEAGRRVASTSTDLAGVYFFGSVPAGTYYLRTPDTSTYHGELYDDVACPRGCRITHGTKVEVTTGAALTDLDFALSLKP